MDRKVTISVKALVIGGLFVVLLFIGVLKIVSLEKAVDNARLVFQVQENTRNIQSLDRAFTELAKQVEEIKKAK
jgi:cell division protein FtsB